MPAPPTTTIISKRTHGTLDVHLLMRVIETPLPADSAHKESRSRLSAVGRIVLAGFVAPLVIAAILVLAHHFLALTR